MNLPPRLQMPSFPPPNAYSQGGQPSFLDPAAQLFTSSPVALGPGGGGHFNFSPDRSSGPNQQQGPFPPYYGPPQPFYSVGGGTPPNPSPNRVPFHLHNAGASRGPPHPSTFVRAQPSPHPSSPGLSSPGVSSSSSSNPFFATQPANTVLSVNTGVSGAPIPFRSKLGHATTPSFHPPPQQMTRRPTMSLQPPPRSPTISRGASPVLSATGSAGFREREEKKRRILVRIPWESWVDEDEEEPVPEGETKPAVGRKRSMVTRRPLDDDAKRRKLEEMDESDAPLDVSTREVHFDEERLPGLPDAIEIYLPGQECWDDMRQAMIDERIAKFPSATSPLDPLSSRLNSYLEHTKAWPSSSTPPPQTSALSHLRSGSLFLPSLPARLQQAYDSVRPSGAKHGSSFSMGGPLSKSFTMPSSMWTLPDHLRNPSDVPLPESPGLSPRPGRDSSVFGSPGQASATVTLTREKGKRLTLSELSRGFGIEEEEEDEGEEAGKKLAAQDGDVESTPSRRMSGVSTKTGIASSTDGLTDADADGDEEEEDQVKEDVVTNPSDTELPAVSEHVHRPSLGTGPISRTSTTRGVVANYSGDEGGYDGSDSGEEPEDEGELSEEYSNPSDEEKARDRRALAKLGKWNNVVAPPNPDHWLDHDTEKVVDGSHELGADVLFEAPHDIDSPPPAELRRDFSFPPRGPLPTPPTDVPAATRITPSVSADSLNSTPPPPPTDRRTSLNVTAPEFVFGAPNSAVVSLTPTFGRSTSNNSLASAGFGSIGAPGSLASASGPPSPTKPALPNLSPYAGEFKPTFNFKLPAEAPTLPSPPPPPAHASAPSSSGSIRTPSGRGPLPAVPLLQTVPSHHTYVKRQKVEDVDPSSDSERVVPPLAVHESPGKDNIRGFKFPYGVADSPHSQGSQSLHNSFHTTPPHSSENGYGTPSLLHNSLLSHSADESPTAHAEDDIPSHYGAIRRSSSARSPYLSDSNAARPFTLRPATDISPDGRVVGFGPVGRRLPIPDFEQQRTPTTAMGEGANQNMNGAAGEGRQDSMDDINLPTISRPKSHAIAIPQKKGARDVSPGAVPKWIAEAGGDLDSEDIFGSDAVALSPMSEGETRDFINDVLDRGSSSCNENAEDEDGDDSPLRMLEEFLERQFDGLRQELTGFTSLKADLDALKHDALIDSLVGRMERLLNDSREVDSDARVANMANVREAVDVGQKRTQDALVGAVKELREEQARVSANLTVQALSAIDPRVQESLEAHREAVVTAVLQGVKAELASLASRDAPTPNREELALVVQGAVAPLRELVVSQTGPAPNGGTPALDEALEKLLAAVGVLEKAAITFNEQKASAPSDLTEELETAVAMLREAAIEQNAFPSKVAASVQPLVAGIFERLADRSDAGDKVIDRIIPTLEILAARTPETAEEIATLLCAQLVPSLAPLEELRLLPDQVAKAVAAVVQSTAPPAQPPLDIDALAERLSSEIRDSSPLADLSTAKNVSKLVEGHEQLDGRTNELLRGQVSLAALVDTLRADVSSRFDQTRKSLDEHAILVGANGSLIAQVAELQSQLAKSRNDHGKVRCEKAAFAERVETERAALVAEVSALKGQLLAQEEGSKSTTMEQSLLKMTVDRLEEELRESKLKVGELEDKLHSARDQQEVWHATELKHISTLAENQIKTRALEVDAKTSSDEVAALRQELAEVRLAQEGLSDVNRKLATELRTEREKGATAAGEVGALEKRIASQDDKIANLQRAGATKQQSLALANQRASEFDKRTAELAQARIELSRSADLADALQSQLSASESSAEQLRQESTAFRERLEQDLVEMKDAVGHELQQKTEELLEYREENERLRSRNGELSRSLDQAQSAPQGYLPPPLQPILRPQTVQPTPTAFAAYPTPPTSNPPSGNPQSPGSSMWAPKPQAHAYPPAAFIEQQNTGSTVSTVHRPSSTSSRATTRSARDIPKAPDGWWG